MPRLRSMCYHRRSAAEDLRSEEGSGDVNPSERLQEYHAGANTLESVENAKPEPHRPAEES